MREKFSNTKVKKVLLTIGVLVLLFGIPIIVNLLFKIKSSNELFVAEWEAGDILTYYGSVLLGIVTIYLANVTIRQAKYANNMNERLLKIEESNKSAYLKLNRSKVAIVTRGDNKFITLEFENITNNIITDCKIEESDKILFDINFKQNEKNEKGSISTTFEGFTSTLGTNDDKNLRHYITVKNLSSNMIVVFKVEIQSIYGFKTIQHFNILISNNVCGSDMTYVE